MKQIIGQGWPTLKSSRFFHFWLLLCLTGSTLAPISPEGLFEDFAEVSLKKDLSSAGLKHLALQRQLKNWGIRLPLDFDFASYVDALIEAEERFQIAHEVLFALTIVESGFRVGARSEKGAQGLFQFMPQTAELYWPRLQNRLSNRDPLQGLDALDGVHSIRGATLLGAYYLSTLQKMFNGNLPYALASYNVGPGAFGKGLVEGRFLSADYVFRIYHYANQTNGRI